MKPAVALGYTAVLCFATLGRAWGPFPLPWKNTAKMPQPCKCPNLPRRSNEPLKFPSKVPAISKGQSSCCPAPALSDSASTYTELASPINQGVDISDTVWEGMPFFSKYADDHRPYPGGSRNRTRRDPVREVRTRRRRSLARVLAQRQPGRWDDRCCDWGSGRAAPVAGQGRRYGVDIRARLRVVVHPTAAAPHRSRP